MSKDKSKDGQPIVKKLRNKYRLVILNDDTFEEKLSLKLSRLNVFLLVGFGVIFLIAATTVLIAFTPLREYIPGYSSTALRRQAFELALTTDSLEKQLNYNKRYLLNIRNIVDGVPPVDYSDTAVTDSVINFQLTNERSGADENLRQLVEEEERFNISNRRERISGSVLSFFTPVKGIITQHFNLEEDHLGVDIVANSNEVIKAVHGGIVVFTGWTAETGHVILVQHPENFISVYKHNSSLLKSQGALIKTGEPIAIIGNSGELTTGPHLHFELWYNGNPVDPESYLGF